MPFTAWIQLLNQLAEIKRPTESKSDTGVTTLTYVTVATGVKCAVQPRSGRLARRDFGRFADSSFIGFFQAGTNLLDGDQVIVDGVEHEVKFVSRWPRVGIHHLEAALEPNIKFQ